MVAERSLPSAVAEREAIAESSEALSFALSEFEVPKRTCKDTNSTVGVSHTVRLEVSGPKHFKPNDEKDDEQSCSSVVVQSVGCSLSRGFAAGAIKPKVSEENGTTPSKRVSLLRMCDGGRQKVDKNKNTQKQEPPKQVSILKGHGSLSKNASVHFEACQASQIHKQRVEFKIRKYKLPCHDASSSAKHEHYCDDNYGSKLAWKGLHSNIFYGSHEAWQVHCYPSDYDLGYPWRKWSRLCKEIP